MDRLRWVLYRIGGLVLRKQHERALDEELQFHLEEEADRLTSQGVPAAEAQRVARRSLGSPTAIREHTRDTWTWPRLEQLARDIAYGGRQVRRTKVRSAAAILSLGLALGACTATFMVMDALLFRPLPVDGAERLYVMSRHTTSSDGKPRSYVGCEYPLFARMRAAVGGAQFFAVSHAWRTDLTYRSDQEMERAYVQYISGTMLPAFGLKPAIGRLLHASDDQVPGGHPQAVITHSYWTRRFNRDPQVLGRTLRIGVRSYEIVGVIGEGFTGTSPGLIVDVLLPAAMHDSVTASDNSWLRLLLRVEPGVDPRRVRDAMQPQLSAFQRDRAATFANLPAGFIERFLSERLELDPASSGSSALQLEYRSSLVALAGLVALVLLVACVNVANLMIARTAARAREMALRTSLGARRGSLVQLVLAESAWLALLSSLVGVAFGLLAAPYIVARVNPPDNPAQLLLRFDWRAVAFVAVMTMAVTGVCGLASAYVTTRVVPGSALRGGHTPRSYRTVMHGLVLLQVAFCFLVVFISGLFVSTLTRLTQQQLGFSPDRVLAVRLASAQVQPVQIFEQVVDHVRGLAGVEATSIGDNALLDGSNWSNVVIIDGAIRSEQTSLRAVTMGWLDTMRIPLRAGRDVRADDLFPRVAIVNETFARTFFGGQNPVGRSFSVGGPGGRMNPVEIVGLAGDARYRSLREPVPPVAYVPFRSSDDTGSLRPKLQALLLVRTTTDAPRELATHLRQEIARVQSAVYVTSVRTQTELVEAQTTRERLLATLSGFFAGVAMLLAAVGLYGVLDYAVLQRKREIGICLALGAPASRVVRMEFTWMLVMVVAGTLLGVLAGVEAGGLLEALLFGVTGTDSMALASPLAMVATVAALASVLPVLRAVRTDLTATMRAD